jgi:4'-phosphopantetheinyl transferase
MVEVMPGDALSKERVDIWKVPLPLSEETIARLKECLNSEERERSGKFRFARDQWRYISARGALRTILGSYLNERPDALALGYGAYGKPFLAHPPAALWLTFNLSHCMDMAVIGVASCRRIGVDVETIRELPELEHIVERHFSGEERASIGAADGEAKSRLFFHIWTRREAAAKARGLDLSAALSDLEIPLYPPGSWARVDQ